MLTRTGFEYRATDTPGICSNRGGHVVGLSQRLLDYRGPIDLGHPKLQADDFNLERWGNTLGAPPSNRGMKSPREML